MSRPSVPEKTRQDQSRASDPEASAWVSANAGSGKTYVLVQRMVRLLLRGVRPDRILALTYTKAAAANMARRVFDQLSSWVGRDDAALAEVIAAIEGRPPKPDELARARRLFAQAIETPGGLKIQTIHAFCERLLQLFPFEANVAARFTVLDETTGGELLAEARDAVLGQAATEDGTPLARALGIVAGSATQDGLATLLRQAMGLRGRLSGPDVPDHPAKQLRDALRRALDLREAETAEDVRHEILTGGIARGEWPGIAEVLDTGSSEDAKQAARLREADAHPGGEEALAAYRSVFFTAGGDPRKSVTTKTFRRANPALAARLDGEQIRVIALFDRLRAVDCLERTGALLVLLEAIFARYEAEKSRRGALDFDDLIARTLALLESHGSAWVLYKLDSGIEHVLIDEAQDTSHEQWEILRKLTAEFFAGEGRARTIFAVGDPKQSIYSFQGAAPDAFARARDEFRIAVDRLAEAGGGRRFQPVELQLSFRSVPAVLSAVDRVFADPERRRGLSFDADDVPPVHEALRHRSPGLVEVWEIMRRAEQEEPDAWARPVDEPAEGSGSVQLARRIARQVKAWTSGGSADRIEDEDPVTRQPVLRPIRAGDVLVLVRTRGPLFDALIRSLKETGVPVAGADRLALADHIAVQDLLALGQASLTPEDDLTLAALLKSPLVGLDDDDLLAFAPGRRGSLARALRDAAEGSPRLAEAQAKLLRWRQQAASRGPFAFFASVLGADGGRRSMLRRLGPEAGDAIDEFLRLALEHEQRDVPALQHFLAAFASAEPVIKRDMEAGRDEVRVMTVHGAKGLEAPIVILPDSCGEPNGTKTGPNRVLLFDLPGGPDGRGIPAWSPRKDDDPSVVALARQALGQRAEEEYRRLLYVAMTRARDRLYVAGATQRDDSPRGCWYQLVRSALEPDMVRHEIGDEVVWRWAESLPDAGGAAVAGPRTPVPGAVPDWLFRAAPPEPPAMPPLRPSSAVEGAEGAGRSPGAAPASADARVAGRLVHALLEVLPDCPPERRRAAALALLRGRGGALPEDRRLQLLEQVLGLLDHPDLAELFGPASLAEVPVTGVLELGPDRRPVPVSGQIDRLAVTAERVVVADFKTNQVPPPPGEPPVAYVAQLAVYRALLARTFPGRRIDCVLVWTSGPRADSIDPALLDATLAGINPA
jgi:ATP-dependent helicase/nuclease subunit A